MFSFNKEDAIRKMLLDIEHTLLTKFNNSLSLEEKEAVINYRKEIERQMPKLLPDHYRRQTNTMVMSFIDGWRECRKKYDNSNQKASADMVEDLPGSFDQLQD